MAKIKLGALAGEVSGSIGCYTFSHNRGGPYVRLRNVPDKYTTPDAMAAKSRLAASSSAWKTLSDADRLAWTSFSSANPVVDTLGEKRVLTGAQTYVMHANRTLYASSTLPAVLPSSGPPASLTSLSITAVAATPACVLTFTPTPLDADLRLWVSACYVDSPSINFIKKSIRLVGVSAVAALTGVQFGPQIVARLGTMPVGQYLHVQVAVMNNVTGQISLPVDASSIIS